MDFQFWIYGFLCMLKHEDVKDYQTFYEIAFQNFFRIENPLSIKEVMSKIYL